MAKAVKLADIAVRCNVSVVTVSKALSGQKGVSEQMRAKIIELANELGYVQPSAAKKQVAQAPMKSYQFGVLIYEGYLEKYASFYWQMYQQVSTVAMEKKCFAMMEVIGNEMQEAMELPHLLQEERVDGVIVIGQMEESYLNLLVEESKIPLVFMDFQDRQKRVDAVISDNFFGAYHATNYLIEMGHTQIAYVGTLQATGSIMDRYLGYVRSLLEHGIALRQDYVLQDRDPKGGNIDEEAYMQLPKEMPTAFFCNCDLTAGHLIRKLEKNGYQVPEDVSVIGYDNYIYPGLCDVEITSYEVDFQKMAQTTVDRLLGILNGDDNHAGTGIVEGHLVEKSSVKRLSPES